MPPRRQWGTSEGFSAEMRQNANGTARQASELTRGHNSFYQKGWHSGDYVSSAVCPACYIWWLQYNPVKVPQHPRGECSLIPSPSPILTFWPPHLKCLKIIQTNICSVHYSN